MPTLRMPTPLVLLCACAVAALLSAGAVPASAQNLALDFDGVDDYLVNNGPLGIGGGSFTVDVYFRYDGAAPPASCGPTDDQGVLALHDRAGLAAELYLCADGLRMAFTDPGGVADLLVEPWGANLSVGAWHRAALVYDAPQGKLKPYLDCQGRAAQTPGAFAPEKVFVGARIDHLSAATSAYFRGRADDLRVFSGLQVPRLCAALDCPLDLPAATAPSLLAYWPMDEGTPGANNAAVQLLPAYPGTGVTGDTRNFALSGGGSNVVSSGTGMAYPSFAALELRITDPGTTTTPVAQICSGDPVHFALYDGGAPLPANPSYSVAWELFDGTGWQPLSPPSFSGFAFLVPPGALTIDCNASPTGYLDAFVQARMLAGVCEFYSGEVPLRICCEPDQLSVTVTPASGSAALCEGDAETFAVSLQSPYPWVTAPAANVGIDWTLDGTPLPQYAGQTAFTHAVSAVTPGAVAFSATVTLAPCGKTGTASASVPVDPVPKCGTIVGLPAPPTLRLLTQTPLVYELCPGDDASLGFDQPFADCIPRWEYGFVAGSTNPADWTPLGATNSRQNTNILPDNLWPAGATEIHYRVVCDPLSTPSACEPCVSNELTIRLAGDPVAGQITGPTDACRGDAVTLTLAGASPAGAPVTWYGDGLPVQTGGTTLTVTESGCYRAEVAGECSAASTPLHCIQFCGPEARISCPLDPNACARLPDPIQLSGCGSEAGCNGGPLTYTWAWDSGTVVSVSGCDLTHVPDAAGTTYTLTVTDAAGCSHATTRRVVPCP